MPTPLRRARVNQNQGAQRETGGVRDFGDPRVAVCNHSWCNRGHGLLGNAGDTSDTKDVDSWVTAFLD
ncbi:hypothetical protein [Nostoc sp. 'Peltigera membranacea cyanobiont' 232]|uniref:hypothetical protein n=1 Tax=Nostoc sp. 'Peltigera membranacea cyanobiont' 232 TaxID=2014531 RepID=UPI001180A146|nr:hypothetical protein [Nostoc sp. 'Peltigera membranacea cyanobiont' 232]